MISKEHPHINQGVVTGAFVGGLLGIVAGLLTRFHIITNQGFISILSFDHLGNIVTGLLLGVLIGAAVGSLTGLYNHKYKETDYDPYIKNSNPPKQSINDIATSSSIKLKEEKLNISKRLVQTGEVNIHKEVFTEEKNITVPITHEELVIEKKLLDENAPGKNKETIETIRIPVKEERAEIIKRPVILEDVEVHKHQITDNKHIEEILRREQMSIKVKGDLKKRKGKLVKQ